MTSLSDILTANGYEDDKSIPLLNSSDLNSIGKIQIPSIISSDTLGQWKFDRETGLLQPVDDNDTLIDEDMKKQVEMVLAKLDLNELLSSNDLNKNEIIIPVLNEMEEINEEKSNDYINAIEAMQKIGQANRVIVPQDHQEKVKIYFEQKGFVVQIEQNKIDLY